ncbi:glycosyltransferase family 39 protein [Dermacoccus sp. PAMC28757]|uniref:ArnT family glycosyltransferase n=1 Tax=Dermacoccus sp. PAMC28757 TaxID=2762331 RepID=UPI00164CF8DE|nr:glycosyltransferase family 39 protein [Dermacoccus sp. PAMC28757]QNK53189.1 glycosyltransferase family 39 protein [Dermacoccus sp. PAMC28757]
MTTTTPARLLRRSRSDTAPHDKHLTDGASRTNAVTGQTSSRGRAATLLRGRQDDPTWARPALFALLAFAAFVYLWDLTNSGYANEFYAAAVKSATQDAKAWLFGSLDASNAITVDKPPASLWVMGLSARIFGFSSFSLLLPQALMGVGTVALTYGAVRRWSGHAAGLFAGLLVTLTPVAALMFRFDNPDAMLVLLMTAAAYAVVRAVETTRGRVALRWMLGAGLLIGFAFLTKMLQGLLVLPGLGLAYLVAARFSLKQRLAHLFAGLVGVVVGAGWLVALVSLWPASARPYIGGSTNNSLWELALGYNGLGRILGGAGNGGGGGGGGGFGGTAGLLRMFNSQFAGEISWLLPAALLLLVAGFVAQGRAPRTDRVRASLILWGGWLVVTVLCLSFMQGTVHSYYAVALAPAIAACVAVGGREAWARRDSFVWRLVIAAAVVVTAAWSFQVLSTNAASWMPWLKWVSLVLAVIGALTFVVAGARPARTRRFATIGLVIGVLGGLGGTTAYTLATITQGHTGSMPASGPAVAGGAGGGPMGGGPSGGQAGTRPSGQQGTQQNAQQGGTTGGSSSSSSAQAPTGTPPSGQPPTRTPPSGSPGGSAPNGAAPGASGTNGQSSSGSTNSPGSGSASSGGATSGSATSGSMQAAPGGQGSATSNTALSAKLDATTSTWSAAVIGDQSAAGYILASDTAVMSIGGWSGSDNNVTLAQFQEYVKNGDITYFIAGGGMGGGQGGNGSAAQITAWVKAHYTATTVGGVTIYDLTKATS